MDGVVAATSKVFRLYFISFYAVAVVMVREGEGGGAHRVIFVCAGIESCGGLYFGSFLCC